MTVASLSSVRRRRPRGLEGLAVRIGWALLVWGRARADRAAARSADPRAMRERARLIDEHDALGLDAIRVRR